jgi:hypothetical protein
MCLSSCSGSTKPSGDVVASSPVKCAVLPCNGQNKDIAGALKILCKNDKDVVKAMAGQKVTVADRIYFEDKEFDGKQWKTVIFEAGGSAGDGEITFLATEDDESKATTIYHEVWHTKQPPGMAWPEPAEDDAYYNTELWTIERGLPGQGGLRTTDADGNEVPDKAKIRSNVARAYPGPKKAGDPIPVDFDAKNNKTKVRDPVTGVETWRPSQKGDSVAGPQKMENARVVPKEDWKCP